MSKNQAIQKLLHKSGLCIRKYSPVALSFIASAGVVVTAIAAAKATPRAVALVYADSRKKHDGDPYAYTKKEAFIVAWKCYIPAVAFGASTIACIMGANALNRRQQAALTSAYALVQSSYKEYKDNQNVNKVIYGGRVLIDLTGDTVDPSKLLKGSKAHDKSGAQIEGACTFDVDSTDATAVAAEILFGKTAYVSGNKLTGTMKNNGAVTKKITTRDEEVTIPQGFHDGSGKVGIDATEKGKLIANNIREGVTILGIEGTMSGSENMKPQAKTVTPSTAKQTILPDTEYNCLSQVEVEAIPYVEADNPAGGVTVTIAG